MIIEVKPCPEPASLNVSDGVNRVIFTVRRLLPVFPDKQISQANARIVSNVPDSEVNYFNCRFSILSVIGGETFEMSVTFFPETHSPRSAAAFDPNAGLNATIKRCADDEQKAKDQLQPLWSQVAPSDKTSYVELLTCLQGQQLVRKLPKD
jgi:hypothetical protein